MQTPVICIGDIAYQALPACLGCVPDRLRLHAEWTVVWFPADNPRRGGTAGFITTATCGARRRGNGRLSAWSGSAEAYTTMTLRYLTNVRSSRQGLRLVAEAHQEHIAAQARPGRQGRRLTPGGRR